LLNLANKVIFNNLFYKNIHKSSLILFKKFNLKKKKQKVVWYNKAIKVSLIDMTKISVYVCSGPGGLRFFKKQSKIFDLNNAFGLFFFTRKPFAKPINKLKLKIYWLNLI